jgi:hypothetical protein
MFPDKVDAWSSKYQLRSEKKNYNPGNHVAPRLEGARALGIRQTLTPAGSKAPGLLISQIHSNIIYLDIALMSSLRG